MSFSIDCAYCVPTNSLIQAEPNIRQTAEEFEAAWKAAAPTYSGIECPGCGSRYQIEPEDGGIVQRVNISMPAITGLTIGSGARTGGPVHAQRR